MRSDESIEHESYKQQARFRYLRTRLGQQVSSPCIPYPESALLARTDAEDLSQDIRMLVCCRVQAANTRTA